MRCQTAAKAKIKPGAGAPLQDIPRSGTRLRRLYDLLQANKGAAVVVEYGGPALGCDVRCLTDFYGLDVRVARQGYRERRSTYILAGEWFGRVYIDYIAERLEAEKLQ